MKRWRSKKAPTPDCPIKALVEQLTTEGWTVAVPFSIPNDCFAGTCGHTPQDTWALAYARHGRGLALLALAWRRLPRDTDAASYET